MSSTLEIAPGLYSILTELTANRLLSFTKNSIMNINMISAEQGPSAVPRTAVNLKQRRMELVFETRQDNQRALY
jgi:hypothetical protein